jgi:hypothetical protein
MTRNGRYAALPTSHQKLNAIRIGYTLLELDLFTPEY